MRDEIKDSQKYKDADRYLEFDLGHETYAIPLLTVKEVIPLPETTPLPNGPGYFVGIMNLRGQVISIIDLRKKLGVKSKDQDLEEAVIIIDLESVSIGLVVDSINKVLNVMEDEISEVPEIESQINAKYIQGVIHNDEKLTIMLDLKGILNIDEIAKHQKRAA